MIFFGICFVCTLSFPLAVHTVFIALIVNLSSARLILHVAPGHGGLCLLAFAEQRLVKRAVRRQRKVGPVPRITRGVNGKAAV